MNQYLYVEKLIKMFLGGLDVNAENIAFIRNCGYFSGGIDTVRKFVSDEYADGLFYYTFSRKNIKLPYEPFMDVIGFYYDKFYKNDIEIEEFVKKCGVYSLQRKVFATYIAYKMARREEPIFVSEVKFERNKVVEGIIKCLDYISKEHNILIVLNNVQDAALGTLDVLKYILENCEVGGKYVVVFDELKLSAIRSFESNFDQIVARADEKSILYEFGNDDNRKTINVYESFVPEKEAFPEYIRSLKNLFYALALDDMEYYTQLIYSKLMEEKLDIEDEYRYDFYLLAAMCYLNMGDSNRAILMCEQLTKYYDKENNLEAEFNYNYMSGQIQSLLSQKEICIEYALKCKKIAEELENDYLVFISEVLYHGAQFSGWKNVFLVDFMKLEIDDEMIKKYERYKFYNTMAHYMIYGYDNDEEAIKKIAEGHKSDTYRKAIDLIKKIGNTELLLSAYTKYIVLFTEKGYYKSVGMFYDAKKEIFTYEKNDLRLSHLYLGMGYNNIVGENYDQAIENFDKAISILLKLEQPEGIAEALYNMAQNCICAEDYRSCVIYMKAIFAMLDNLGLETIQICNVIKLYAMICLSYAMLGNNYRCFRYLKQINRLIQEYLEDEKKEKVDFSRDNEIRFLYYLLNAISAKNDSDFEKAGECFERAHLYFDGYPGILFYGIVIFVREYYDYFIKINKPEAADKILEYGVEFCLKNGYKKKAEAISRIGKNDYLAKTSLKQIDVEKLDKIVELSERVGKSTRLNELKKELRFLASWQEMLNGGDLKKEEMIYNTMCTVRDNFNLEDMLYIKVQKNCNEVMHQNMKLTSEKCDSIVDFFRRFKREFVANRIDKSFLEYESFLKLIERDSVFAVIGIPVYNETGLVAVFVGTISSNKRDRQLVNDEDLSVMKTAIIQLNNAVDKISDRENIISINSRLNELAITDNLTGLLNRQGMEKVIKEEMIAASIVSIMYIDLDNFKYYNDNFGHDIGDIILKEFAYLFKREAKDNGYVVRYGGDEFLIILNDIDINGAKQIAENIYDYIHTKFLDVIKAHIGKMVEIPKGKEISCSMGLVSSRYKGRNSFEEILKHADEALYYMKRGQKGNYVVWEDINENN